MKSVVLASTCWLALAGLAQYAGLASETAPVSKGADDASAEARRSLVRLVPADAGLCIEIDRPAALLSDWKDSGLGHRLELLGPFSVWHEHYQPKLEAIGRYVAKRLDVASRDLGRQLFSQSLVVAVWSDESAEDDDHNDTALVHRPFAKGLLLLRARDAEFLSRVVAVLNRLGGQHGGHVQQKEHAGAQYTVRLVGRGTPSPTVCVAAIGTIGVITTDEQVMRDVLELHAERSSVDRLVDTAGYREAAARRRKTAAIRLFLQPRRWDGAVLREVARAVDGTAHAADKLAVRTAADLWKASRYWTVTADLRMPLLVDGYLSIDRDRLTPEAAEMLASMQGEASFLRRIPSDAVLAFAGRVDIAKMATLLLSVENEESVRKVEKFRAATQGPLLGLDFFDEILASMGPEMGSFLLPPEGDEPVRWAVGTRMRRRAADDPRPQVEQALNNGLRQAMTLIAANLEADGKLARVETIEAEGARFTSLEGTLPESLPLPRCFAFWNDYFLLGSSRDVIRGAIALPAEETLLSAAHVRELLSPAIRSPSQLLYVDSRGLRRLLDSNPEALATVFGSLQPLDALTIRKRLMGLLPLVEAVDAVVVAGEVREDGIAMSLGIAAEKPEDESAASKADKADDD